MNVMSELDRNLSPVKMREHTEQNEISVELLCYLIYILYNFNFSLTYKFSFFLFKLEFLVNLWL